MSEGKTAGSLTLRRLELADLEAAQGLSRAVSWPHRVEDWQFVHGLGFGVAAEADGALLGTAMAWPFGAEHAALGMVIVAPAAQGRGLGRQLTSAVLAELEGRVVQLNATTDGFPLYASLGFVAEGEICQHQGAAFSVGLVPLQPGERLRPMGRSDAGVLAAMDRAVTGQDRGAVLEALLAQAEGVALERDGETVGFSLLRRFGRGHVIGPVIAPDEAAAKALIAHWLGVRSGQFLRIDVPLDSGLSPWLQEMGLAHVGGGTPMRRGPAPMPAVVPGGPRRYALINQALG
ncbi:GNAT family N-acetyltransferase [Roseomonas sp. 18066]|uniref:GNAT family N-acetyltransferase n=1 Tax=Roseomonas sp. 18066 TaxID=2681412 RepID=UPI001F439DB8|nr:GNAT family N-acetyltransferase [Roseomonas sp. 18066]